MLENMQHHEPPTKPPAGGSGIGGDAPLYEYTFSVREGGNPPQAATILGESRQNAVDKLFGAFGITTTGGTYSHTWILKAVHEVKNKK